jgi:hypothetical protein
MLDKQNGKGEKERKKGGAMQSKRLRQIEKEIDRIKRELQSIGEMRPGSLTRQYKEPKKKTGSYYQISYTHKMKSHTEYVPAGLVQPLRRQIAAYKRFKRLVERWVALAIERSKLYMGCDSDSGGRVRRGVQAGGQRPPARESSLNRQLPRGTGATPDREMILNTLR